jgi:hypothetical protein
MLGVVLVNLGLALVLAGAIGIIRPISRLGMTTPPRAAAVALAGVLVVAGGFLVPAREQRALRTDSRLDEVVPRWQFAERHEVLIHATPAAVERAIRAVTPREIALFRALTWLRHPRLPWHDEPASILAAPADEPILAVALRSGFLLLDEEPGREVVFGTLVARPPAQRRLTAAELAQKRAGFTAERFRAVAGPGYAKAVMSFRWSDEGGGWTRVVTETRVFATDGATARRFAVYWRLIYPGSSWIRRAWLAAIRSRAEAGVPVGG